MAVKLGIIREGKVPPDKRVPLTPRQCREVAENYKNLDLVVQTSDIRAFSDEDYRKQGISVVDDLSDCDIIMGVKEVNIEDLIPHKHFFFFSHTIKKQPYNRDLLQAVIDKNIQLTDYEVLTNAKGVRLIGFGRYAGIVGCYNGFRTYGLKHSLYDLKPAYLCEDRKEMEQELQKVTLPTDTKIVLTGYGRVGHGAREVIELLPIKKVSADKFLSETFEEPVYAHLDIHEYNERADGKSFDKKAFYNSGEGHKSKFPRFLENADLYIACHFWKEGSPFLFTREDLKSENVRTSVVADISCDIDGPVPSTIRPSTIADPIYGYNPVTEAEDDFKKEKVIAVMAVDNLPCELPKDASEDFGNELMKHILPALLTDDPTAIIDRGSETTKEGRLSKHFSYLQDYLDGKE